jgi:hypothetical protein
VRDFVRLPEMIAAKELAKKSRGAGAPARHPRQAITEIMHAIY